MSLKGQAAVITGASYGIGEAVARDLAAAGMKLVVTARREERLRALAAEAPDIRYVAADICEPEMPQRLIDLALKEFGRCDVVFNNAGIARVGTIKNINLEDMSQMVRVNVEASFRMAYVALKYFCSINQGHLVNTSSVLGTKTRPTAGAYSATKFAIEALSEALRMELARTKVRISCIQPGFVLTGLHDTWDVHPKHMLKIEQPLMPEDIARCVRFVLEQPEHVRIPRMMMLPGEHEI